MTAEDLSLFKARQAERILEVLEGAHRNISIERIFGGWRAIVLRTGQAFEAEQLQDALAQLTTVLAIDGEGPL